MSKNAMSIEDMRVSALFESGKSITWDLLKELEWPWEALGLISAYINELGAKLDASEYDIRENNVRIHKSAKIAPSAFIGSNVIIGADTEVRHCAFIRNDVIVGNGAVIGNSTELKNVILFDKVQVPHYNYVGDSILGYKSHFGAGVITSNVKSDSSLVSVKYGSEIIDTDRKKFGAIVGDNVEIGCNAVLNPGTVIGANATVYPLSMVRGFVPADSIYKKQGDIASKRPL
ncbi:MAG: UDP-N-acetylglucosamine pyrophosphorylase [Oscillospiraceae bacterium]|nr:UDP-N-acetylglucosamine pyrophosphorylase [Oscillospiraceae bacterium]